MARFNANNQMATMDTYHNRKYFQESAYKTVDGYLMTDFLYENPLYGKVDASFNAVYPNIENLKVFHQSTRSNFALNFVVDAFGDLRKHISQAAYLKKIDVRRSFIGDFIPERSYVSVQDVYRNHLESYIGIFSTNHLFSDVEMQASVITFEDFFYYFRKYVFENLAMSPLTLTNFIKSRYCSYGISGLVVEISDNPESDDDIKIRNYINDPNFNFYINAARKFGFFVDKNCPWRLIADISSERMFNYMKKYAIGSVKDLFANYYTPAYTVDILILKQILFNMYNEFVDEFPYATKNYLVGCTNSTVRPSIRAQDFKATAAQIPRETYTQAGFEKKYPDIFWLIFYMNIRLSEARIRLAPVTLKTMEKEVVRRYKLDLSSGGYDYSQAWEKTLQRIDNDVVRLSEIRYRRAKFGAELYLSETHDGPLIDRIRGYSPFSPARTKSLIELEDEARHDHHDHPVEPYDQYGGE
tara:strand:- start:31 stop:1440 length:1410 start_codon:yes stop_codon:yes gene_type:complete